VFLFLSIELDLRCVGGNRAGHGFHFIGSNPIQGSKKEEPDAPAPRSPIFFFLVSSSEQNASNSQLNQ